MIDISVIVPIFNIPSHILEKCIRSIIGQTISNIEIILINDGSTNDALTVCNNIKEIDDRIVIIDQVNQGVSTARNKGIDAASGSWIAFVDPDDWLEPQYLEKMWQEVSSGADIIICNCKVHDGGKIINNDFMPFKNVEIIYDTKKIIFQLLSKVLGGYYPAVIAAGVPWAKLFKRSFIVENNLRFIPKMARMQDNIFCLYAFSVATSICFIPDRNYNYRKENEASVSFRFNEKIFEYFEKYFYEVRFFIDNKFLNNTILEKALNAKIITSINSYFLYYYLSDGNNKTNKENREHLRKLLHREPYKTALKELDTSFLSNEERIFVAILRTKSLNLMRLVYFVKRWSAKW
ncbi:MULTISPECIES: glycosyltransferase family 2 protein [Klebsiella pneumoniae complex]|uniref:glycosyltransferase family 2 protein n=1 Tax=Klebsiella pneumoniae complex TaxID=3390273 RepID=UPI000651A130|nr:MULTISPECIES: glycosyltransferase family 2 protein [Klebsiella]EKV8434300.1 glycosyltransferase family 2 protein [Klebsiella variicola]KMI12390.1 hypothetical protein SM85_03381 [Klebsiella variicola]MCZ9525062.1 glycosyltransferase [Klebsiella quasipneumoniae]HDE1021675.1 glycosyltransferase family 2 protein [Klebsiella quasipneumoniae]